MSFGKMRALVQILSTEAVKDSEGFSTSRDTVLAEVQACPSASPPAA